jgi:hypothetical protein
MSYLEEVGWIIEAIPAIGGAAKFYMYFTALQVFYIVSGRNNHLRKFVSTFVNAQT